VGSRWIRGAVAGLAGGVAWLLGLAVFFGPAQTLLTNPELQSAKMLAAFAPGAEGPRMLEAPAIPVVGILGIGLLWGLVYAGIASAWAGAWWKRGLAFGLVGFTLMVPWFEFYLPWNVLREPAALVVLELVCWLAVLLLVGVAIAGVDALGRRRSGRR
jgi:hypothetical protein